MRSLVIAAMIFLSLAGPGAAQTAAAPPGEILTDDFPYDTYRGWLSVSMSEEDDAPLPSIVRVRGDAWSRFYYLIGNDFDAPPDVNDVRSEDGTLLARVKHDRDYLGVRRTPTKLVFVLYHSPRAGLPRYDLVVIERGKARVYACRVDRAAFEAVAGRRFADMAALGAAAWEYANEMVNALQDAEPALVRDHCVATDNGVPRGKPDRHPVLTRAFPHVGDLFVSDGLGLKGGWLYAGKSFFGPSNRHCCSFYYHGDNRDAVIIGDRVHRGRETFRIRLIFYIDGYVRWSGNCEVDGDNAIIGVADAQWRNGRAWLSDGKTVRIVRWTDTPPKGCEKYP